VVTRLAAAVLATAAAALAGLSASAAVADRAVRAEVAVAGEGYPLDVRRVRVLGGLKPGESYRLPSFGIRNHSGIRTAYHPVVFVGATHAQKRSPRRWLHFLPATVVIDAGQTRAVGVRLELPDDAGPGRYAVVLGIRPGGSEGARLTFRIEPAESTRPWLRQAANLAMWVVPTLLGVVLAVFCSSRSRPVCVEGNGDSTSGSPLRREDARAADRTRV